MGEPSIVRTSFSSKKSKRKSDNKSFTICDSLMRYADMLGYGEIHTKIDKETGLKAIIAVNNLNRGPAIGGCRMLEYSSVNQAQEDVLRLGYMMSYKAAINNLPHGGAKSVILKPKVIKDREALFAKFGEFVHELGGKYITAIDSGTSTSDMDIVEKQTPFVTCTSSKEGGDHDPSPLTALGVTRAIEASVKYKMQRDTLEGVHIAIQGTGHVGYWLAQQLHERGASLTVTDINQQSIQRCVDEFGAAVCKPEDIYSLKADVFAPCALGHVLNLHTINKLNVKIVAGSANNQLSHTQYGHLLHDRGILYAPDFLINAGGLIHVSVLYNKGTIEESTKQVKGIYDTLFDIYERAKQHNLPTSQVAMQVAREKLNEKLPR